MPENKSASSESPPKPAEKPTYPIYGAHPDEPIPANGRNRRSAAGG
jgi:hypothetical protein